MASRPGCVPTNSFFGVLFARRASDTFHLIRVCVSRIRLSAISFARSARDHFSLTVCLFVNLRKPSACERGSNNCVFHNKQTTPGKVGGNHSFPYYPGPLCAGVLAKSVNRPSEGNFTVLSNTVLQRTTAYYDSVLQRTTVLLRNTAYYESTVYYNALQHTTHYTDISM